MKKIITSFIIIIMFLTNFNSFTYAKTVTVGEESTDGTSSNTEEEETWASQAFSAAKSFLNEGVTTDGTGVGGAINSLLEFFTEIVRAINIVLLTALAGISMIALSIVGVRYIASGADPMQRRKAIDGLHTVFHGMIYGFGAFIIWDVAMAIVRVIIGALA